MNQAGNKFKIDACKHVCRRPGGNRARLPARSSGVLAAFRCCRRFSYPPVKPLGEPHLRRGAQGLPGEMTNAGMRTGKPRGEAIAMACLAVYSTARHKGINRALPTSLVGGGGQRLQKTSGSATLRLDLEHRGSGQTAISGEIGVALGEVTIRRHQMLNLASAAAIHGWATSAGAQTAA